MNDKPNYGQEFLDCFLEFFESETVIEEGKIKGRCSGDLSITKTFALSVIDDPNTFLNNLALLGVVCDCKFLQAIGLVLVENTGYGFESITKTPGGMWLIEWEMKGFRTALQALNNQAIGVKIMGAGYFPPDSTVELMLHETQNFTVIMVKEAYSQFRGEI